MAVTIKATQHLTKHTGDKQILQLNEILQHNSQSILLV